MCIYRICELSVAGLVMESVVGFLLEDSVSAPPLPLGDNRFVGAVPGSRGSEESGPPGFED